MTREQAINYLISSGFTHEQVGEVVRALTYELTTKNDSSELEKNSKKLEKDFGELDCISRADAIKAMQDKAKKLKNEDTINGLCGAVAILFDMPSVTPQEPQKFKWCTDCKEYDREKHCCHRWSKVIRDTVEEMKQEPEWIPVSEKLPEPFTFVNATCRSLVDDRENWVVETIYLPIPKEANKHGYSDWGNIPMLNWGEAEVIAWVERIIPQPYKAEVEPQESEVDNGKID